MNEVTIGEWTVTGLDGEGGVLVTLRADGPQVEVWVSPEGAGVLYSSYRMVPLPVLRAALDMGERMLGGRTVPPEEQAPSCTTCANYVLGAFNCPGAAVRWAETWDTTVGMIATEPPPGTPMCPGYRRRW